MPEPRFQETAFSALKKAFSPKKTPDNLLEKQALLWYHKGRNLGAEDYG
jgi:hypothetical protein